MSTRRVYLHIGAPKTGTTYLQDRLSRNVKALGAHGVTVPTRSPAVSPGLFHFRAALDLLGQDWGGDPGHAEGSWDAMVRRVRRSSGSVIISHEILAPAPAEAVARAKRELGGGEDVHVVYSARDLARQLPAAWQESIKQGRKWTYRQFLKKVRRRQPWFYRSFDLPSVLGTWSAGLPPENVHVVTVPQRGTATPDELWHRFCAAFEIDPAWAPEESGRRNPSLGAAETVLLRRLNKGLGRQTRREITYDVLVRDLLAEQELAGRAGAAPLGLPPKMYDWVADEAERWIEYVEGSGVDVLGDVADLRPVRPSPEEVEAWVDPDKIASRDQLDVAVEALVAMTREAARREDPDQQLVNRVRTQARRLRDQ
ncbi:hypothetical protein I601_1368 [Nocardioides dokdonensis FR1436]|uniref:Sulfotransferase family protein n=1 Tax=Nocardioides dokdonensis FR1436 TaxID=1300347 RepID=A0A1A9GHM8_9ACTN|nr:hypothetical protein [Nocardioides dokdonensis]ANH37807.1 hypothetical protein I601_1368 [Nocardioides dokdonensis FR1436]